ncbi:MAG: cupredoxin domain-containing protein [Candidatus Moraniibacteriota bacterium]
MWKIIGLVLVLVIGGFLFFSKEKQVVEAPVLGDVAENTSSMQQVQEITVEAHNWYFVPEEIRVKEGTKVKIIVRGISGAHIFAIPDFSVKSQLVEPGETTTVEFVADKKGEFSFKCAVFCGEGHSGMTGRLIVE